MRICRFLIPLVVHMISIYTCTHKWHRKNEWKKGKLVDFKVVSSGQIHVRRPIVLSFLKTTDFFFKWVHRKNMVVISSFSSFFFSRFKRSNKIELNLTGVVRSNLIKYTFWDERKKNDSRRNRIHLFFIRSSIDHLQSSYPSLIEHWSYQFSIYIWIINRPLDCIACLLFSFCV